MSIRITSEILPASDKDTYPLMDARYIKGGLQVVDTYSDIPTNTADVSEDKMYFVKDEAVFYSHDGTTPTEITLPHNSITGLEAVQYLELKDEAILPTDKTMLILRYDGDGNVDQTLPNMLNVREGMRLFVQNHQASGVITLLASSSDQKVVGSGSYSVDVGNVAELIADKGASTWQLAANYEGSASTHQFSGIEVDDGTSNVASVSKINVKGMEITELPSQGTMASGEIELTSGINVHMQAPNDQYGNALTNEITVVPPLKVFADTQKEEGLMFELEHGVFEPIHAPSFLAYLKEDEEIVGKMTDTLKHHKGALWFDDIVVPTGPYIFSEMGTKSYGVQEYDNLDPNISGGINFLISFRAAFKGVAPNDGIVRLALIEKGLTPLDTDTGYLLDINGEPLAVERHYKAGEKLGVLDIVAVVNAKALKEFQAIVVDTFENDRLILTDRTEGGTSLMIQALASDYKTGDGLQQFELDTQQNIEFSSHYLGQDRFSIGYYTQRDAPVEQGDVGQGMTFGDGIHFYNSTKMQTSVSDGHVILEDNGIDTCYYNFGKIFSAEETLMMHDKQINVTVTLTDKNQAFKVYLMKWVGKPDEYTDKIITDNVNDLPVYETDWVEVDSLFISEDIVSGDHTASKTFSIPNTANNYAIIIAPIVKQQPSTLKLKEFKVDVLSPFTGYILHAPELANELHLSFDTEYKQFSQDNQGYASLRYTLSNAELPMPVGEIKTGAADITIDTSVNQVTGSGAKGGEGAIKFNKDGDATVHTMLRLSSEQPKGSSSEVKFWYAIVSKDGSSYSKIPESELTCTVNGGAKNVMYRMPSFTYEMEKGERIALRAQADKVDGAFLQSSSPNLPMVHTNITFKELVTNPGGQGDTTDLVNAPYDQKPNVDRRVIPFSGITSTTYTFDLDIPEGVEVGGYSVVGVNGGIVTSLDKSEFSYNNITKKMIVFVGSFTDGKIYLTFWG